DAEHGDHFRPLLSVRLIRRVPDALIALERGDQGPDVIAGDRVTAMLAPAAAQKARQHLVLGRTVQKLDWRHAGKHAPAHLECREVRGEEDDAFPAPKRGFEMLATLDFGDLLDGLGRAPPREGNLHQRDAEALEVARQESLAL